MQYFLRLTYSSKCWNRFLRHMCIGYFVWTYIKRCYQYAVAEGCLLKYHEVIVSAIDVKYSKKRPQWSLHITFIKLANYGRLWNRAGHRLFSSCGFFFLLLMASLRSRCGHYTFFLFLLLLLLSSHNLSGRRLDVYHTSTHGVALVRI